MAINTATTGTHFKIRDYFLVFSLVNKYLACLGIGDKLFIPNNGYLFVIGGDWIKFENDAWVSYRHHTTSGGDYYPLCVDSIINKKH